MKHPVHRLLRTRAALLLLALASVSPLVAQPEFTGWGNVRGLKIDGEKMPFETSLRSVRPDWSGYMSTEQYNWEGTPVVTVEGTRQEVIHTLMGLPIGFDVTKTETGADSFHLDYKVKGTGEHAQAGLYFCTEIPGSVFASGRISIEHAGQGETLELAAVPHGAAKAFGQPAARVVIESGAYRYEITPSVPMQVIVRHDWINNPYEDNNRWPEHEFLREAPPHAQPRYQIYFQALAGNVGPATQVAFGISFKATGPIDREPVGVVIDPSRPGRTFEGVGGNIKYHGTPTPTLNDTMIWKNVEYLKPAWVRLELAWTTWQPREGMSQSERIAAARQDFSFVKQMEIMRELARRGINVIVSVWDPPLWATDPKHVPSFPDPRPTNGILGRISESKALDNAKLAEIAASITGYFQFLKREYGVEPAFFSFNEADYGVRVSQTAETHAQQSKAIGEAFADAGLVTKMLVADTGAGYAKAADISAKMIQDPALHRYAGTISLHTYHGLTPPDLARWAEIARVTNLPVIVAEGGPDSAMHRYERLFLAPWLALLEADEYVRICNVCQPRAVMVWQLTANYSLWAGEGVLGEKGELRRTQRFWNLRQLGASGAGAFWIPATCDKANVSVAAFADIKNGRYGCHLVNNGARRTVRLTGLPARVTSLRVYRTSATLGMDPGPEVPVVNGAAEFELLENCFTTVVNARL